MVEVRIDTSDSDDIVRNITAAIDAIAGMSAPLEREAQAIIEVAKTRVPYVTGRLYRSADEIGINVEDTPEGTTVSFGFGEGESADYAAVVHETPGGRGWKFLELPLMEAIAGMEDRLAEAVRAELPGVVGESQ